MKTLTLVLAVLALTGCETCKQYPTACAAVTLVAVGSIAMAANHGHNRTTGADGRDYTIQPVNCTNGSCK